MRCSNCGWENPNENLTCEKCNSPLQSSNSRNSGSGTGQNGGDDLHSTIREGAPFEPTKPTPTIVEVDDLPPGEKPIQTKGGTEPTVNFGKTINPYAGMGAYVPVPRCILKPIVFPGEDARYAPSQVNLKGDFNQLNRENLDPDNHTITSKVQATITNKNGKWYIQNQSGQKTTYVYAADPIEIKSGDIILMGNRSFIFEED